MKNGWVNATIDAAILCHTHLQEDGFPPPQLHSLTPRKAQTIDRLNRYFGNEQVTLIICKRQIGTTGCMRELNTEDKTICIIGIMDTHLVYVNNTLVIN